MSRKFFISKPFEFENWDGYLDWLAVLGTRNPRRSEARAAVRALKSTEGTSETRAVFPVLVRVRDENAFDALLAEGGVLVDPFDLRHARWAQSRDGGALQVVVYVSDPDAEKLPFEVLMRGPDVRVYEADLAPLEVGATKSDTIFGIIDDGLGFLNQRFLDADGQTRILAMWQQAVAPAEDRTPQGTRLGRVHSRADLQKWVEEARIRPEPEVYRDANRQVYRSDMTRSNEISTSHGTLIMDLACGAQGGERMSEVPILAVQLPPEAVDDTSGVRMQMHLLQAVRWLIQTAEGTGARHLVINASVGVTAGQKDGSSALEQALKQELERAGDGVKTGMRVDLVMPVGNDFDDRQVARLRLGPHARDDMDLVLHPDDETPSFVEFRKARREDLSEIDIILTPPGGSELPAIRVAPGRAVSIQDEDSLEIGRLYHVPERMGPERPVPSYLTLALAPTSNLARAVQDDDLLAPSGRWRIGVRNNGKGKAEIRIMVQRDDGVTGYATKGRQAVLDAPDAWDYDASKRDHRSLGRSRHLVNDLTENAFATFRAGDRFHVIGGAEVGGSMPQPAGYSAWHGTTGVHVPTSSAISEDSFSHGGVSASGTFSNSSARLSGTSTASATFARMLLNAEYLRSERPGRDEGRLGSVVVLENPAIRR